MSGKTEEEMRHLLCPMAFCMGTITCHTTDCAAFVHVGVKAIPQYDNGTIKRKLINTLAEPTYVCGMVPVQGLEQ